jgi:hypothetical protein
MVHARTRPRKTRHVQRAPLDQKYAGHDNNRDFYMANLRESVNMNRQLFLEWFPQIMYNHHQTGPLGTVIFAPPFRDPFNYNIDPPSLPRSISVGAAMHSRFVQEDKPGSTMRSGANYSTWYNGGLRTTTYFHNMIGLLTEIIGSPTPMDVAFVPNRQLPAGDLPMPIAPQKWHYRQSIDYSLPPTAPCSISPPAEREHFLFNIWKMGKNSIDRGSKDSWTVTPKRIEAVKALIAKESSGRQANAPSAPARFYEAMKRPELRDPRGYIIPADQPDFPTAVKFINALVKNGIQIHKATAAFTVAGKTHPAASYIVKTAQAFRRHVLDMFEPQDHPNDFRYEGGPPIPPYEQRRPGPSPIRWASASTGASSMPSMDPSPSSRWGVLEKASRRQGRRLPAAGDLISHKVNDSFILTNRSIAAKQDVFWLKQGLKDDPLYGPGALYVPANPATRPLIEKAAAEFGFNAKAVAARPAGEALKPAALRIALWDEYGGSMPSGWVRFLLERFEFPFEAIYPQAIDAGNLRQKYDVILFVGGAIPRPAGMGPETGRGAGRAAETNREDVPAQFQPWLGRVTAEKSVPQLKAFLESGGAVITIGSSNYLAAHSASPSRTPWSNAAATAASAPSRAKNTTCPAASSKRTSITPSPSPMASTTRSTSS